MSDFGTTSDYVQELLTEEKSNREEKGLTTDKQVCSAILDPTTKMSITRGILRMLRDRPAYKSELFYHLKLEQDDRPAFTIVLQDLLERKKVSFKLTQAKTRLYYVSEKKSDEQYFAKRQLGVKKYRTRILEYLEGKTDVTSKEIYIDTNLHRDVCRMTLKNMTKEGSVTRRFKGTNKKVYYYTLKGKE